MTRRPADLTVGATFLVTRLGRAGVAFLNQEDSMNRFSALVAAAFALAVFVGGSLAQAQTASDAKSQPGSGQCRLSNGQRC